MYNAAHGLTCSSIVRRAIVVERLHNKTRYCIPLRIFKCYLKNIIKNFVILLIITLNNIKYYN